MRARSLIMGALSIAVVGVWALPAGAVPPGLKGPIKATVAITGAQDFGTCNNVWALDTFNKAYTLTANHDGTYTLNVDYRQGRFVTVAGMSPGACETTGGSGPGDNSMVGAGITGNMHQSWSIPVTAASAPNRNPDCAANNGCVGSSDFLTAVFGSDGFTKAPQSDWTYTGHYEAGRHGTWVDTWANWPFNDRGDITS